MKFKTHNFHSVIWATALLIFYFMDAIDKVNRALNYPKVAFIARSLFVIFVAIAIILRPKYLLKDNRLVILIIVLIFTLLGYMLSGIYFNESLSTSFYVFSRYLSFLIFLYYIFYCVNIESLTYNYGLYLRLLKIMAFIYLLNCVFAWVGFIFDVNVFRTYGHIADLDAGWIDQRFGYDGFLLEQNNATYFYIIGFIVCYWLYLEKKLHFLWLIFGFSSCFIVGTKSLYIALLYLAVLITVQNIKLRLLLLIFFTIICFALLIPYLSLVDKLSFRLLNSILSGRLNNFENHILPLLKNINFSQLFFGVQGGDPKKILVEMELVDIFSFFGILGGSVYMYICLREIKKILRITILPLSTVSVVIILMVSFFSGHLFYDPVSSFYFATLLFIIYLGNHSYVKM